MLPIITITIALMVPIASAQRVSPVVGVLSQPTIDHKTNTTHYMIAASYVKWLEVGGARSIPIPYDATPALVKEIFGQINGLLLPGGASDVPSSVWDLLKLAVEASSHNDFFPVWGTCLGFEYLVEVFSSSRINQSSRNIADSSESSSSSSPLEDGFDAWNISLALDNLIPLDLYADPDIYDIVSNYNVTMNNHHIGVTPDKFLQNDHLSSRFDITSTNTDRQGRPFVSTIEPKNPNILPVYGVQYHPEKNSFEYATYPETNIPYEAIDHSPEAVQLSTYTARFFVELTHRNQQQEQEQQQQLLQGSANQHDYTNPHRHPLVQTYPLEAGLGFEQIYVIPPASHWTEPPTSTTLQ